MPNKGIRVLVVDDSALMCQIISQVLSSDPDIEVVGTAADPLVAREKIKTLNPDVMTLDVEMPRMDGLSFLSRIMTLRPMPVVMVSSVTEGNKDVSLRAMELGAVDVFHKPAGGAGGMMEKGPELIAKVKAAANARVKPLSNDIAVISAVVSAKEGAEPYKNRLVALASSTGGVDAVRSIVLALPPNAPPVLVALNLPPGFSHTFAARLNGLAEVRVKEAMDGEVILPGHVYIAPGLDLHMGVEKTPGGMVIRLWGWHGAGSAPPPCPDHLFRSMATACGSAAIGVILTGTGTLGGDGLLALRKAGAATLAQDEASCMVYEMPAAALALGAVEEQFSLAEIPGKILSLCQPDAVRP